MNDRKRGGLDISIESITSDFKPRPQPHTTSSEPAGVTATEAGFTTRHAPQNATKIDGRSLRSTNRTAQLNIAVHNETRDRFWTLAQATGVQTGEDFLLRLMDTFVGG